MQNRNVGWLVIGISLFIGVIIWIFNSGVSEVLNATCSMGPTCSMHKTLALQTWISVAITFVILCIGLFLVFSKENERVIIKKIKPYGKLEAKEFDKKSLKDLDSEEKKIMNLLLENKGSIFQSELADKTGMNKVKITRLLDSLEGRGLIERKRRGMTNIVILKR